MTGGDKFSYKWFSTYIQYYPGFRISGYQSKDNGDSLTECLLRNPDIFVSRNWSISAYTTNDLITGHMISRFLIWCDIQTACFNYRKLDISIFDVRISILPWYPESGYRGTTVYRKQCTEFSGCKKSMTILKPILMIDVV